jgi:hypothetical protein
MNTTAAPAPATITAVLPNGKAGTFTLYENGTRAALVMKNRTTGERCIVNGVVRNGRIPSICVIPLGLASFAAGKDAWLRTVRVKCNYCDAHPMAGELEGNEMCPDCYEKAGEENAAQDGW